MTSESIVSNNSLRPEGLLNFNLFKSTLPVIIQTESAECGLACLAMISSFFGQKTDLNVLRSKFSVSSHGATLKQIMAIATSMNLSSRALKLELSQLEELQMPCVLHWDMKHFVVLKEIKGRRVVIHDPAVGERSLSYDDVDKSFTGIALELSPTSDYEKKDDRKKLSFSSFWKGIFGLKRSLLHVILLSFLLQIFAIAGPYYMQIVVDDVILRQDLNLLTVLAIGFFLLLVIETATSVLRKYVNLNLASRLSIQMASNLFQHLIRLPIEYFSKRHIGDVVSRFGSLGAVQALLTDGIISVVIDGLMAIIILVVMFAYDATLTFVVLLVVSLYAILRWVLYRPIRLLNEEVIVASAAESSHFMESIRAIQTVKLFGRELDRQNQWQNKLVCKMNKDIKIAKWNIGFSSANALLFGVENIVIVYLGAQAVISGGLSVGMLYAFVSYKSKFMSAVNNLIDKWIEFRMLDLHFDRLADIIITKKDKLLHDENLLKVPTLTNDYTISGDIKVSNLGFTYSDLEPYIFKGVDLTVSAGETVAIVGPSGSGKSTLLKCLMGFIEPSEGEILIDNTSIEKQIGYRREISAVLQDDQLLSGTIAENISCFDENVDMHHLVNCALKAQVHEEISQWPMQYNTLVGDMGSTLSGGQKQRIILARALYRKPKILFMDEATSHLDITNEALINKNIRNLEITRILVAHRPETIATADRVLELRNGVVIDITSRFKKPLC